MKISLYNRAWHIAIAGTFAVLGTQTKVLPTGSLTQFNGTLSSTGYLPLAMAMAPDGSNVAEVCYQSCGADAFIYYPINCQSNQLGLAVSRLYSGASQSIPSSTYASHQLPSYLIPSAVSVNPANTYVATAWLDTNARQLLIQAYPTSGGAIPTNYVLTGANTANVPYSCGLDWSADSNYLAAVYTDYTYNYASDTATYTPILSIFPSSITSSSGANVGSVLTASLPSTCLPSSLSWAKSSTNYYVSVGGLDSTLRVYKVNTGPAAGGTVSTGSTPQSVAFSPNGNYLAVANQNSATIQAYTFNGSAAPTALGNTVSTGYNSLPNSIAFSPDNNFIAVACPNANSIQIYTFNGSTISSSPVATASPGGSSTLYSVAWSSTYVSNSSYYLTVSDLSGLQIRAYSFNGAYSLTSLGSVYAGGESYAAAFSPNGNFIALVTSSNNLQVFSFNGSSISSPLSTVATGSTPISVAWSPNGSYIAVVNSNSNTVQVFSFNGSSISSSPVASSTTGSSPQTVAFSPNGNYIAVANKNSNTIGIYNFNGSNSVALAGTVAASSSPYSVAFSPNSTYIAATLSGSNTLGVYITSSMSISQVGATVTTAAPVTDVEFSLAGNYIATTQGVGGGLQIYSFNGATPVLAGSSVNTTVTHRKASWSHTGSYLATVADDGLLRAYSFAGSTPTLVTSATAMTLPTMCAWSPSATNAFGNYILTGSPANGGERKLFYFDPIGTTFYSA